MISPPEANSFPAYLDSSMISAGNSCEMQFFFRYIRHLAPKTQSVHLIAGGAFAAGIEAFRLALWQNKQSQDAALKAALTAAILHWGDYTPPDETPKSLIRVGQALYKYFFEWYKPESDLLQPYFWADGSISAEMTFAIPLPGTEHPETNEPIMYVGRPDFLGVYGADSLTMLLDEKTCSQLGAQWTRNWDLRSQFIGYNWATRQILNIKPEGTIVRGICFRKNGLDTAEVVILQPDYLIERWLERTVHITNRLVNAWKTKYFAYDFDNGCTAYGGCSFLPLCTKKEYENWIDLDYNIQQWDPIGLNDR
jgi:hypothetical protein